MKRAIEERINTYVDDMIPRFQTAAVSSLAVGNFPAYAENVGSFMALIDIEKLLRGEIIKTPQDHIKDKEAELKETMARATKEQEQERLKDVAVL